MADIRDLTINYGGFSAGRMATASAQYNAFHGWSIKNGFTPSRNIDSGACTLAQLVTVVQTLIHDLCSSH